MRKNEEVSLALDLLHRLNSLKDESLFSTVRFTEGKDSLHTTMPLYNYRLVGVALQSILSRSRLPSGEELRYAIIVTHYYCSYNCKELSL